ncbi:MAG: hypothetical protein H0V44_15075 [Planctomycetes bacterium]|nr:hypothetical protein [Planctomycetota bacterium]
MSLHRCFRACARFLTLAALAVAPVAAATVSITAGKGYSTSEGSETVVTLIVRIDQAPAAALTVSYAITGTASAADYSGPTGSVVIQPGQKFATITVQGLVDDVAESSETVVITLNGTSNANAVVSGTAKAATVTIYNSTLTTTSTGTSGWDLVTNKSG